MVTQASLPLDLSGASDGQFIFFRQLIHTQNGNDILNKRFEYHEEIRGDIFDRSDNAEGKSIPIDYHPIILSAPAAICSPAESFGLLWRKRSAQLRRC